jgi:NAD(P)-dependent dehydrogenase (short-subunit alcohol dehydrogenase family)
VSESNKVALITGGGSGIGRETALILLKAGYKVVVSGRRRELLEETLFLSGTPNQRAIALPMDVTKPDSVRNTFFKLTEKFKRLDLLFNNAGINAPGVPFEELTFSQWKAVVDVNLNGFFLCASEAYKLMKEQRPQGGRIINNGSISAHAPRPESAPYTATKHAVTGLTKSLSLDGRKYNICCGQIDIGNAASDMTQRMARGVKQATGEISVEPLMDVTHVAESVLHMANLPLESNIQFLTVMASKMPFVGRG